MNLFQRFPMKIASVFGIYGIAAYARNKGSME